MKIGACDKYLSSVTKAMEGSGTQFVRPEIVAGFAGMSTSRLHQLTADGIVESKSARSGKAKVYDFLPTIQNLLLYYSSLTFR